MANKITLNDGTEYTVQSCGESDGYLVIRLENGVSVLALAQTFSDAEKTKRIIRTIGSEEIVHEGFTELEVILHHIIGNTYTVELRKE